MADYTRLHVVFAGRGDTLILEHDELDPNDPNNLNRRKVLTLIDGGPLYQHGGLGLAEESHSNTGIGVTTREGAAPYYKHLMAALREIWGHDNPLVLRSMINTHPDDDHYGGLLRVLGRHQNLADFHFDGSFYTPYWPDESCYKMIARVLRDWDMYPAHATANLLTGLRVHIHYPPPPAIGSVLEFNRNPMNQQIILDLNNTMRHQAKDKNDGSILGIVKDANNEDVILFTGDGSADRIETLIDAWTAQMNPPGTYTLPIYKIQHHGGWLKQHANWDEFWNYGSDFTRECFMYSMLAMAINTPQQPLRRPWWKDYRYSFTELSWAEQYVEYFVEHCLAPGRTTQQLYDILQARRRTYTDLAMGINFLAEVQFIQDGDSQEIHDTFNRLFDQTLPAPILPLDPTLAQIANYNTQFMQQTGTAWNHVWKPVRKRVNNQMQTVIWYSDWHEVVFYEPFLRDHREMNLSGQIRQFYSKFQAQAYVVSGSYKVHGHPKVPVLMGLAHAVRRQNRRAILYVTDPGALFTEHLERACWFSGFTRKELFCDNNLQVHYLATLTYMSLNAEHADLLGARDIGTRTERLVDFASKDRSAAIVTGLEKTAQVLPALNTNDPQRSRWMIAARAANGNWWYLRLRVDNLFNDYTPEFFRPHGLQLVTDPDVRMWVRETADLAQGRFRVEVSLQADMARTLTLSLTRWDGNSQIESWNMSYLDRFRTQRVVARENGGVDIVPNGQEDAFAPVYLSKTTLPVWAGQMVQQTVPMPMLATMQRVDSQATGPGSSRSVVADNDLHLTSSSVQENLTKLKDTASSPGSNPPGQSDLLMSGKGVLSPLTGYRDPLEASGSSPAEEEPHSVPDKNPEAPDPEEVIPKDDQPFEGQVSLRKYLEMTGFPLDTVMKQAQALAAVLGANTGLRPDITKTGLVALVLESAVDLENSEIQYKKDINTGFDFTAATLTGTQSPKSDTGPKLQLDEEEYSVAESSLVLTRNGLDLQAVAAVVTTDGMRVGFKKTAKLTKKLPTLRSFLAEAQFPIDKLDQVSMATLFYFLFGGTSGVLRLFGGSMPTVLLDAVPKLLKPDLDQSVAERSRSPFGAPELNHAVIVTKLGGVDAREKPSIDLSVVKLTLTDISFEFRDLRKPNESIAFIAAGTASLPNSKNGIELRLSFEMTNQLSEMSIQATYLKSIDDLAPLLSLDTPSLNQVSVPMTKSAADAQQTKTLSDLSPNSSAVGFAVREVGKGSGKFQLASVSVSVKFNDWKDWLPGDLSSKSSTEKSFIDKVLAQVTVFDPTEAKLPRVRVEVKFIINLPQSSTDTELQPIYASFVASPLGTPGLGGHDFRLSLRCPAGISIGDVCRSFGLDVDVSLNDKAPIFDTLLNKVKVTGVGIGVEHEEGKTRVSDWSVSLLVQDVTLLPNQFTLRKLETTVAKVYGEDPTLYFEGHGQFFIHILKKRFDVDFKTPQLDVPGSVSIHAKGGLSLGELLQCVGAGVDLSAVPIIREYADVKLIECGIDFGYVGLTQESSKGDKTLPTPTPAEPKEAAQAQQEDKTKHPSSLALWGINASFQKPSLTIGKLTFSDLSVEFSWRSPHDMFTLGKHTYEFGARATLPGRKFSVRLSYSSQKGTLGAELLPLVTKGNTIGDLLDLYVSAEIADKFKPIVGDLSLRTAAIKVDLGEKAVESFEFALGADESLELDTDTAISVRSLSISYRKGRNTAKDGSGGNGHDPASAGKEDGGQQVVPAVKDEKTVAKPEGDPTRDLFVVKGVVVLNGRKASVKFTYLSATKESAGEIKVTIGSEDGALELQNLVSVLGLAKPNPDTPNGAPGFLKLRVTKAEGVVEIASKDITTPGATEGKKPTSEKASPQTVTKSRFSLSSLSITVETKEQFVLFEDPPTSIDDLYLKVDYHKAAASAPPTTETKDPTPATRFTLDAFVHGSMTIGSQRLDVAYKKDSKLNPDAGVFIGEWSPKNGQKLDFKDVTDSLLVKHTGKQTPEPAFDLFPERRGTPSGEKETDDTDSTKLPHAIPIVKATFIFMPGHYLQVSAEGSDPWSGRFADLDFKVRKLGGYIRVAKPTTSIAKSKYEVSVRLRGELEIGEFTSAISDLDISPPAPTATDNDKTSKAPPKRILTARIMRKADTSGEIGGLASKLSSGSGEKHDDEKQWGQLTKGTAPLKITGEADLIVDFSAKLFFVRGHINDSGSGVLLGHRHPTKPKGYAFVFALAVGNVHAVWPQLKEAVSDAFEIRKVAVQVLTYKTTPKELAEEIMTAVRLARGEIQQLPSSIESADQASKAQPMASQSTSSKSDEDPRELLGPLPFHAIENEPMTPSAWFLAEVVVGGSSTYPMSSSLALASAQDGKAVEPSVLLYACVDMDDDPNTGKSKNTKYTVAIQNLSLAGGVVEIIEGVGSYTPGDKSTAGSQKFSVDAKLRLKHEDLSSHELLFDVALDVSAGTTSFKARFDTTKTLEESKRSGPSLSQPFQDMFNVELVYLQISGTFIQDSKIYALSGQVRVGGSGEDEKFLSGVVLFEGTRPRGVLLTYDTDAHVPVQDFTSKYLQPSTPTAPSSPSPAWPSSHPNFRLESVTVSYLTPGNPFKSLTPGYRLSAKVYLFNNPFTLALDVGQSRSSGGIRFTAMYNDTIDLEILRLVGHTVEGSKDGSREKGPALAVDATKASNPAGGATLETRAGVSFLGIEPPMDVRLTYGTQDKSLGGKLKLPPNFLGIPGQQEVEVTYKNGKVSFSGLGLADEFAKVADLSKLIRNGSKKGPCSKIVDFVFQKGVTGKFFFGLGLPGDDKPAEGEEQSRKEGIMGKHRSLVDKKTGKIMLKAKWRYDIAISTEVVLSVPFDDLDLPIDQHIKGSGLVDTLLKHVEAIVPYLAEQIFKDPPTVTKLTAIFAIEQATKELVDALFCRRSKDPRLSPRGQTHVEKETEKFNNDSGKGTELVTAAEVAIGAAIAAEVVGGLTVAAGPLLGAIGIGAGIIVGLIPLKKLIDYVSEDDPKRKKDMQDCYDKAKAASDNLQDAIKKAKEKVQDGMSIIKPIDFKLVSDEPQKKAVEADWSSIVPNLLVSTAQHPQDITWTVQFSTSQDFKTEETTTVPVKSVTSRPHVDTTTWPLAAAIFCRVRGSVVVKKEDNSKPTSQYFEATNWGPVGKISRVPFLPPPTSVVLAHNGKEGAGSVFMNSTERRIEVRISVPNEDDAALVLFNRQIAHEDTSKECTVDDVRLLLRLPLKGINLADLKSVTAYARSIAIDKTHRDSGWTASIAIPVVVGPDPAILTAVMKGPDIEVSWTTSDAHAMLPNPLIYLVNKDDGWSLPASTAMTKSEPIAKEALLVPPPSIKDGDEVTVALCDRVIRTGSLAVWSGARMTVDYLPVISIDSRDSFLDLQTHQLMLSVSTPFRPLAASNVLVRLTSKQHTTEPVDKVIPGVQWKNTDASSLAATAMIAVADIKPPLSGSLQIIVRDPATSHEKGSPQPWVLAVAKSRLPVTVLSVRPDTKATALLVSWVPIKLPPSNIYTHVRVQVGGTVTEDVDISKGQHQFSCEDKRLDKPLTPGSKFVISARVVGPQVRGKPALLEYTVPTPEVRVSVTDREPVLRDVVSGSNIAAWGPPSTVCTIWAASTKSGLVGVDVDLSKPEAHINPFVVQDAATPSVAGGCSFACTSTSPARADLFWVDAKGVIQARQWVETVPKSTNPREFRNVDTFPFASANAARTTGGASLAALSRRSSSPSSATRTDLWWTSPDGHLLKATCTTTSDGTEEWSDADYLVWGEMGPAPGSTLASCSSSNSTDIVWITASGRVHGLFCGDPGDVDDGDSDGTGTVGSLYCVAGEGASPGAGIAVMPLSDGLTRVWWIAQNGSAFTAVRRKSPDSSVSGSERWHLSLVAEPDSASDTSKIAVAKIVKGEGMGKKEEMAVWWTDKLGAVVCARASGFDELRPMWYCQEVMPAGTMKAGGGGGLVVAVEETGAHLCYVDADGRVLIRPMATKG